MRRQAQYNLKKNTCIYVIVLIHPFWRCFKFSLTFALEVVLVCGGDIFDSTKKYVNQLISHILNVSMKWPQFFHVVGLWIFFLKKSGLVNRNKIKIKRAESYSNAKLDQELNITAHLPK